MPTLLAFSSCVSCPNSNSKHHTVPGGSWCCLHTQPPHALCCCRDTHEGDSTKCFKARDNDWFTHCVHLPQILRIDSEVKFNVCPPSVMLLVWPKFVEDSGSFSLAFIGGNWLVGNHCGLDAELLQQLASS